MTKTPWTFADPPAGSPGWYAVLVCWDPTEGVFPDADKWTGDRWEKLPVAERSPEPFASEAEALAWAQENDPGATLRCSKSQ